MQSILCFKDTRNTCGGVHHHGDHVNVSLTPKLGLLHYNLIEL